MSGISRRRLLATAPGLVAVCAAPRALSEGPVTPEILEAYNTWLFLERRHLMHELYPSPAEAEARVGVVPWNNPGSDFYWVPYGAPAMPQPSTRAAAVLKAAGAI